LVARSMTLRENLSRMGVAQVGGQLTRRFIDSLWSDGEVIFFENSGEVRANRTERRLEKLDLNQLASAVSQYANDQQTCTYLLRSAARFRTPSAEGFALADAGGKLLHFAWVKAFQDFFLEELNAEVDAPSEDCVMLFDCWTPQAVRGRGYYGETIAMISKLLHERGSKPWIFSAATNIASIRGLQKSGFQPRYSLVRQRRLGFENIRTRANSLTHLDNSALSPQRRSHVA